MTRLLHLGAMIDTRVGEVYLSQDCRDSLVCLIQQIRKEHMITVALLSRLLGKNISCIDSALGMATCQGITVVPSPLLTERQQGIQLPGQSLTTCITLSTMVDVPIIKLRVAHSGNPKELH